MAETHRVDVKNLTDGPKIFNGLPPRTILAGQSAQDLDVTEAELDSMRSSGWFEVTGGGAPKTDLPGLTGKSKAKLLEIAKAEGVEIEDGATNEDIVSAIELHREG